MRGEGVSRGATKVRVVCVCVSVTCVWVGANVKRGGGLTGWGENTSGERKK